MNKTIGAVVLVVVVVAAGWYLLSGKKANMTASVADAGTTVATVNGAPILRSQLTALEAQIAAQQGLSATSTEVASQFQTTALDSLIAQMLLEQAAEKAGFTASSTEVDAQMAAAKKQFGTDADYQKALAAQGMTEADLRSRITKSLIINAYLNQQLNLSALSASDAEIEALFKQLSSGQPAGTGPKLSEVRDQVAKMVLQQKQQDSINAFVAQLRAAATVEILVSSSTPSGVQ